MLLKPDGLGPRGAAFDGFSVVCEHPSLLLYVDALQRNNAESLSFYPRACFEREAAKHRILLALLNGEPCGYIYMGAGRDGDLKCHQVCIQYDARRRLYGAALVACMEEHAERLGVGTITLRCGFDLEANLFWASLGYRCVRIESGGARRMRQINIWRKAIREGIVLEPAIIPASGKTDASVWRRFKDTGVVTQFVRGARMADYRMRLLEKKESSDGR